LETSFVDISRVSVREISKAVARDFIEKHHYTHKFSSTRYALGIFYREETEHMFFAGENEQLIGCMTYGHPVSNRTQTPNKHTQVGFTEQLTGFIKDVDILN